MINENEIQVFIDSIKHYFSTISDSKAIVGTPYLTNVIEAPYNDYVGIIDVSGSKKGKVYVSAARAMLRHLLLSLGEQQVNKALVLDIVGELANTISGNVRQSFGSQFVISPPIISEGANIAKNTNVNNNAFSVPFRWKNYTSHIIICLH